MEKKLFILRHAHYDRSSASLELSETGKDQAKSLARRVEKLLDSEGKVTIWTSQAKRAVQTGEIIANRLESNHDVAVAAFKELGSEEDCCAYFEWFKGMRDGLADSDVILVMHAPGIEDFMVYIAGEPEEWCNNATGFVVQDGKKIGNV